MSLHLALLPLLMNAQSPKMYSRDHFSARLKVELHILETDGNISSITAHNTNATVSNSGRRPLAMSLSIVRCNCPLESTTAAQQSESSAMQPWHNMETSSLCFLNSVV